MLTFEDHRGIGANQHGTCTCTASRASCSLRVYSNVAGDNDGVAAVPRARLDPVNGVEKRGCSTVASVLRVDALNVKVTGLGKEVHEGGLDRFRLVDDSLSADFDATDGFGVNVKLLEQPGDGWTRPLASGSEQWWQVRTIQSERVDVFTVIWPGHVLLTETNGVFAFRHTVEHLEITLRDALALETTSGGVSWIV